MGNVGGKLAGSLVRNGLNVSVHDLVAGKVDQFLRLGARQAGSPAKMAAACDVIITCLPNPAASASVLEGNGGVLEGLSKDTIWCEMSTTDEAEVRRLGAKIEAKGGKPADCPVSGGCHRAATGNIAIFAGCERPVFEMILPVLAVMGRRILHCGPLGSASKLKVVTNYLASANLVSICEALVTSKLAGLDLNTTYEAIRISSGNSFVHETESQVILNGSRNINFTLDLVVKDMTLFQDIAERAGASLEVAPLILEIFKEAESRYGPREWSPNVIRRLEDGLGITIRADGFPEEIVDDEPEQEGREVRY